MPQLHAQCDAAKCSMASCAGKDGLVANITLPGTEIRALLKDRSELMTLRGANSHLVAGMQQRADPFAVVSEGPRP